MLVVNVHALHTVNLLHLLQKVKLHAVHALGFQKLVGIYRTLGNLIAGLQHLPLSHAQFRNVRHQIFRHWLISLRVDNPHAALVVLSFKQVHPASLLGD